MKNRKSEDMSHIVAEPTKNAGNPFLQVLLDIQFDFGYWENTR